MPDPHPHLTLFFAVWAPIGPLAGILIGHLLTRSWDKKRWLLECRKQEFKELVQVLNSEALTFIHFMAQRASKSEDALRYRAELIETHRATLQVLHDRIYIARDILEMKVQDRFHRIMDKRIQPDGDAWKVDEDIEPLYRLLNDIVARALNG